MMRFALAAMLLPAAAAAPTCTEEACCADIVYGKCTGNTHAAPVGAADPQLDAGAGDHTCTAGYMTGAGITCPDAGCDDATCCTAHTTTTGCSAGQYLVEGTSATDEACTACPAGKWQAESADRTAALAAGVCEDHATCAAGEEVTTAGTASADTVCGACAAGKFNTDGVGACTTLTATCPVGQGFTAQATVLETDNTCADCPEGKFNALDDALECADANPTSGCAAGKYLVLAVGAVDEHCADCAEGSWQAESADRAAAVTAGVCELHSATACTTAGEGNNVASALTTAGKTLEVVCTACPAGKFSTDTAGDNSCTDNKEAGDCAAGTVFAAGTDVTGPDGTCTSCVAGTDWDHDADAGTACEAVTVTADCDKGFELFAGSATVDKGCVGCVVGEFQAADDSTAACIPHVVPNCPAGEQPDSGTPSTNPVCEACPEGTFTEEEDASYCVPHRVCVAGEATTAGTASADASCAACPAGKTSDGAGAACEAIVGQCDNGLDADDFACGDGMYMAGNYRREAAAVTEVVGITAGCYVTGSTTDNTGCNLVSGAATAVTAVTGSATVYAVAAVAAADPVCSAGCEYVQGVAQVNEAAAIAAAPFLGGADGLCPEPPTEEDKAAGAAAAAPFAVVAALVVALA